LTPFFEPYLSESRGCASFKTSKGEAVAAYRKPLATQKMGCHRLFRRVNKMGFEMDIYNSPIEALKHGLQSMKIKSYINNIKTYPILFTIIRV
jgi:hypothetical protein